MGHIDHGKSTLLDFIRKTNTTSAEAGGITQRMSAYKVERVDGAGKKQQITFLDTPGHEAFGALRGRGARVADIAILVVAADEGVKPQTLDALKAIRESGLPFIVAANKIDKPNADMERTKQSLAENEIFVEGYGGDVPIVPVSAVSGQGVDDLLDMVSLMAELQDLKTNPSLPGAGTVIGAENSKLKGISGVLMIKDGTLHSGTFIVSGGAIAPTRILEDFQGKKITSAVASDPVQVVGFSELPKVGSPFFVVETKKEAEALALKEKASEITHEERRVQEEGMTPLPIIIKASSADVIDAIFHEIRKIKNDRVYPKVVHRGIGFISEADVKLALGAPGTIILGFDTKIDAGAKTLSERANVKIETFTIIYKLTEWLEEYLTQNTPKVKTEEIRGKIKVLKSFSRSKDKQVIGCRVEEGEVTLQDEVRILRRESEIGRGKIKILQQMKSEVKEIKAVNECGVCVEAKIEIVPGDYLESFVIVEK